MEEYTAAATLRVPVLGDDPIDGKSARLEQVRDQLDSTAPTPSVDSRSARPMSPPATRNCSTTGRVITSDTLRGTVGNGQLSVTTDQTGDDVDVAKAQAAIARKSTRSGPS